MKVETIVKYNHPKLRCTAEVGENLKAWRARYGQDFQCDRVANVLVDGKPMCNQHAGRAALQEVQRHES